MSHIVHHRPAHMRLVFHWPGMVSRGCDGLGARDAQTAGVAGCGGLGRAGNIVRPSLSHIGWAGPAKTRGHEV